MTKRALQRLSNGQRDPADAGPADHVLLAQLVAGDRTAGRQIWDRYVALVEGLLRGVFGPAEEIDDAVQEVFVRLLRSAREIEDGGLLRSYIVTLALNVARAELRRRKVRRLFHRAHDHRDVWPAPGFAPAAAIDPNTQVALGRLYRALDRLPTEERLLFTLRHVHELELTEIAGIVGVSLATIKRRLARASTRLVARVRHDVLLAEYVATARADDEESP